MYPPIRGIEDAAGGVLSASRSNSTKKATKMFIPAVYRKVYNNHISTQYRYMQLSKAKIAHNYTGH